MRSPLGEAIRAYIKASAQMDAAEKECEEKHSFHDFRGCPIREEAQGAIDSATEAMAAALDRYMALKEAKEKG